MISPFSSPVEGWFKNTGLGYHAFYCGSNPFLLIFVLIYMNATVDNPSMLAGLPILKRVEGKRVRTNQQKAEIAVYMQKKMRNYLLKM